MFGTEKGYQMKGYHVHFIKSQTLAIVHAPTDNWQHYPLSASLVYGFWVGPLSSQRDAEVVAKCVASFLDYEPRYCAICFRDKAPTPPTQGDHPRRPRMRQEPVRSPSGTYPFRLLRRSPLLWRK